MIRAAIYARYSSENQREASLEDQTEVCRRYAEAHGWRVAKVYADRAVSGASRFQRDGYRQLETDAERRGFDVVVVEALDRLGRKLADIAGLYDRLAFLGIRVHAVNVGEISHMHIGLLGTMAQLYLSDLKEKTKRGQLGRVRAGRIPAGLAYGYRALPGDASGGGARAIDPVQAAVVRRIFTAYADGESPRAIARRLNAEGVPGPSGRAWQDTTIRGHVDRGTGILNNPTYVGRLEWNRCSYVKDPRTGRRIARVNDASLIETADVPELRILDQALWERVRARQETLQHTMGRDEDGNALNRVHRRRFLLSGLVRCGVCGGGYTIMAKDRYGCAAHRGKGTCDNGRTVSRHRLEGRVLAGIKERLLSPELVALFVEEFVRENNRLRAEALGNRSALERELAGVVRKIETMLNAIEDGMYQPSMKGRMSALEDRKAAIEAELARMAGEPAPPAVHPGAVAHYRRKVEELERLLAAGDGDAALTEAVRRLITRAVLVPDATAPSGLRAEIWGELAALLAPEDAAEPVPVRAAGGRKSERPPVGTGGRQLSVVAGAGFEPAAFRL